MQRYSLILGWHALRLCEGRGGCQSNHALRRASERATRTRRIPKLSCNAALVQRFENSEHTVLSLKRLAFGNGTDAGFEAATSPLATECIGFRMIDHFAVESLRIAVAECVSVWNCVKCIHSLALRACIALVSHQAVGRIIDKLSYVAAKISA